MNHLHNGSPIARGDPLELADPIANGLQVKGLTERLGSVSRRSVSGRTWKTDAASIVDFIEHVYFVSKRSSDVA